MKTLLTFICLCLPAFSFCQSSDLIDSVNDAIGPDYVFVADSVDSYHIFNLIAEASLFGAHAKQIIVVAGNADSTAELNKIFILERKDDDDLAIIDSSSAFDIGYLGPHIEVKGSDLIVIHNFDKGSASLFYHFNKSVHRYTLIKLRYSITEQNYPDYDHSVNIEQIYDVESGSLTLKSYLHNYVSDKAEKQKTKVIAVKKPKDFSVRLSKMKDPYDYDFFLTEGKVYNQMMKF